MIDGRTTRTTAAPDSDREREPIHARLDSLNQRRTDDSTRRIGPQPGIHPRAYDGSLARPSPSAPQPGTGVEPRAYLMTADGGVLAELPIKAGADPIVIGRGRIADVRLDDPYVHRRQAEITWDADQATHVIAHGGGENGTYVNRHRVRLPLRLIGGERLRFGKTTLVYRVRR